METNSKEYFIRIYVLNLDIKVDLMFAIFQQS